MDELPPQPQYTEQASGQEQEPSIEDFYLIIDEKLKVEAGELGRYQGYVDAGVQVDAGRLARQLSKVEFLQTARERLDRGDFGSAGIVVSRQLETDRSLFSYWPDSVLNTPLVDADGKNLLHGVTPAGELKRLERMQRYAVKQYIARMPDEHRKYAERAAQQAFGFRPDEDTGQV